MFPDPSRIKAVTEAIEDLESRMLANEQELSSIEVKLRSDAAITLEGGERHRYNVSQRQEE